MPLCRVAVKKVARGAAGFGLTLTSPELPAGKELVLAMNNERQRDTWFDALERAALVCVFTRAHPPPLRACVSPCTHADSSARAITLDHAVCSHPRRHGTGARGAHRRGT
jgi:hypothetical protein